MINVSTAGGRLFADVGGQGKMELLAASDSEFAVILPDQTIKVTIEKGKNDEVDKIRIDSGEQSFYAKRVK